MQIKGIDRGFRASADDESHIWINETEIVNLRLGKNELNAKGNKNCKIVFYTLGSESVLFKPFLPIHLLTVELIIANCWSLFLCKDNYLLNVICYDNLKTHLCMSCIYFKVPTVTPQTLAVDFAIVIFSNPGTGLRKWMIQQNEFVFGRLAHPGWESRKDGCCRQPTALWMQNMPDVEVERRVLEHAAVSQIADTPLYSLQYFGCHSLWGKHQRLS